MIYSLCRRYNKLLELIAFVDTKHFAHHKLTTSTSVPIMKFMTQMTNHDVRIIDYISESKFTVSAEVIPPRNGAEQTKILGQIDSLVQSGAEFLSVTKGAGGSLRGGSLPIAHTIKDKFNVPCIAHFTCRDLTPQEVENQMMDHHYFGIRNILALRGDPPQDQPNWKPLEGSHEYAYQLIEQIEKLNQGEYLKRPNEMRKPSTETTQFCIGAAVYPEHPDPEERIEFFRKKVQAGAEYGITQMVFDTDIYGRFLDLCEKHDMAVPILPGTRIVTNQQQALRMGQRFGVNISKELIKDLPESKEEACPEKAVEVFYKFTERLKSLGAPGIHLFVLSDTELCSNLIKQLRSQI